VDCPVDHAFAMWTSRIGSWWPRDHTMSGEPGAQIVFEDRVGGRIFERTSDGVEHEWGEVLAWDPPHRLAYTWRFGAGSAGPTEVEVGFRPSPAGTEVSIEHRGWERFGPDAASRRDANRRGWSGVFPLFVEACAA
jgi:uncharacterized protein YndB with AHSA1/START domain